MDLNATSCCNGDVVVRIRSCEVRQNVAGTCKNFWIAKMYVHDFKYELQW